jgi:hypothetical protein
MKIRVLQVAILSFFLKVLLQLLPQSPAAAPRSFPIICFIY